MKVVLQNPVHAGLVAVKNADGQTELIQGAHFDQRIYDPETHHQIVGRLGLGRPDRPRPSRVPEYLLGGLARCAHCGYRLNGRRVDRQADRFYRCPAHLPTATPECKRNSERADLVEGVILEELRRLAADAALQEQARARVEQLLDTEEQATDRDLQALQTRRAKLWDTYRFWSERFEDGLCDQDEFEFHVARFRDERQAVEARIKTLQETRQSRAAREAVVRRAQELVGDFGAAWEGLSAEQRREFLHTVLDAVTVGRLPQGDTEVKFTIRGFAPVSRTIGRRYLHARGTHGPESLTPREQAFVLMIGEGMSRRDIMRKVGVSKGNVASLLSRARQKLGVATDLQAWEAAREHIEANRHWLPMEGRVRKQKPEAKGAPLLTDGQCRLLQALASGMRVKKAAAKLGIADKTAYVQLMNCRARLGVASNEEAVRKARDLGYITGPGSA